MQKWGMEGGQLIEHKMLNRGIEKAQQRVEQFNFEIRKSLIEYDEVMNEQRKLVYDQRQKVLKGENIKKIVWEMIEDRIVDAVDRYLPPKSSIREWDFGGLSEWVKHKFNLTLPVEEIRSGDYEKVEKKLIEVIQGLYEAREKQLGEHAMRGLEKYLLLEAIDSKWKDHLYAMDELKSGIGLEAYAQKDPKVEYKKSGYQMFDQMIIAIKEQVSELIFKLEFEMSDMQILEDIWQPARFSHDEFAGYGGAVDRESWEQAQRAASAPTVKTIRREQPKVGRNDPCPCGSGRKYKKCCGKNA
jgi:preprotein translocase subunit SecA